MFGKKNNLKELSKVEKSEIKKCMKDFAKAYEELLVMPDGTKEKGDKLQEIIKIKERQYKITSDFSDRMGLQAIKKMYTMGIIMKKWRR